MKPVMDYKPNTVLKQGHTETEVGEKTVSTRKLLVTQNKRNTNRTTEGEGKLKTEHPVPSTKFRESRLMPLLATLKTQSCLVAMPLQSTATWL